MTAPDVRTYHDPAAEAAARAFEAAVDALDKAAYDCGADDSTTGVPKDVIRANHEKADAARAALIAAHAAAVDAALQSGWHAGLDEGNARAKAADAAGYARAMGEVDAACDALHDYDGGGRVVMIGQTRARRRGKWHAWPEEVYEPPAPDAPTATAAILAAAAALIDTSTWTEADPPALVNGGPAVDGLDES